MYCGPAAGRCRQEMPPRHPPRGFRRVVRWQLGELSLLLGSDTGIFRSDEAREGAKSILLHLQATAMRPQRVHDGG